MEQNNQETLYWKERYLSILNQNQEIRNENKYFKDRLEQALKEIEVHKSRVEELEQRISTMDQNTSISTATPSISSVQYDDLAKTLCASNSSIQTSINRALTFKRQVTKEYNDHRSKSLPSNFQDEIHEPSGPTRMYEDFFILGVKSDRTSYIGQLESDILYQFHQRNILPSSAQSRVISNFCFPRGSRAKFLKLTESTSSINEVIYTTYERSCNPSFVFTLKSEGNEQRFSYNDVANGEKEFLYCCCVIVDDLISDDAMEDVQIVAPKCYCIVSYCPCFELHFTVLYSLLSIKKVQRQSDISEAEITRFNSFSLETVLQNEQIINEEQLGLLEEYYSAYAFRPGESIFINLQSVEGIEYDIPQDLSRLDSSWFCPMLFSLLDFNDFFWLLCAIMQEKSVVFVSTNYDYITSCILGFLSLMRPFN